MWMGMLMGEKNGREGLQSRGVKETVVTSRRCRSPLQEER